MRSLWQRPLDVEHADIWRQASASQDRDPGRDRPPSIQATGRLAGGGRYSLAWHYLPDFPAYRETVRVDLTRSVEEAFETQLEAFARVVSGGAEPYSGLKECREDIGFCQKIVAAFAERTAVPVGGEIGSLTSRTLA